MESQTKLLVELGYPTNVVTQMTPLSKWQMSVLKSVIVGNYKGDRIPAFLWLADLIPLTLALIKQNPNIKFPRIWYDVLRNYSHIAFDINKEHFDIDYRSSYRIVKNHIVEKNKIFSNANDVLDFFNSTKYTETEWQCPFEAFLNINQIRISVEDATCKMRSSYGNNGLIAPKFWGLAGDYFFGKVSDGVNWLYAIRPEGDAESYTAFSFNGKVIGKATHFYTVLDYLLIEWPWYELSEK